MKAAGIDRVFSALADPNRRAMIEQLCISPASVKELADPIGMRLPSAVKHLQLLEGGGLVISTKKGRVRTYAISPTAFSVINEWVDKRRAAMNAAFDQLEHAILTFEEERHG